MLSFWKMNHRHRIALKIDHRRGLYLSKAAILIFDQRPRHDIALVRQLGYVRLREPWHFLGLKKIVDRTFTDNFILRRGGYP